MSNRSLHLLAVGKNDSKMVSSCHDSEHENDPNKERLEDSDNDRVFGGSGMARPELVRDSNTEKKNTEINKRVFGTLLETLYLLLSVCT